MICEHKDYGETTLLPVRYYVRYRGLKLHPFCSGLVKNDMSIDRLNPPEVRLCQSDDMTEETFHGSAGAAKVPDERPLGITMDYFVEHVLGPARLPTECLGQLSSDRELVTVKPNVNRLELMFSATLTRLGRIRLLVPHHFVDSKDLCQVDGALPSNI